jgi:hypothetical protein
MTENSSQPEFRIGTSALRIICFSCPRHNELATIAGPRKVVGFRRPHPEKQDISGLGRKSRVTPPLAESSAADRTVGGERVYTLRV